MNALSFVCGTPRPDAKGHVPNVEYALCGIRAAALIGLVAVVLYGLYVGALRGATIAFLAAAAAFATGSLFGFLFGVPRWSDYQVINNNQSNSSGTVNSVAAAAAQPRPNTGLERVMDWLTTLIVGLGLVHLKDGYEYGTVVSVSLTGAIQSASVTNGTAGAVLILAYTIAGFFMAYLWAQRYMAKEMASSYAELQDLFVKIETKVDTTMQIATVQSQTLQDAQHSLASVAEQVLSQPEKGQASDVMTDELRAALGADIADDVEKRYAERAQVFSDDPMKDFGPESSNDRRITATVKGIEKLSGLYEVTVTVTSTDPQNKPLPGKVALFLHHTLKNRIRIVPVEQGSASIKVLSIGAFAVGVAIPGEHTKLSLDLAELPGAPEGFKSN